MPKARSQIEDGFIRGRLCAICGSPGLKVVRIPGVPDHVSCGACGSAFVVEDGGDRVMYGKIPADYPLIRRFALRQWAWLEAIERKAQDERRGVAAAPPIPDWASAAQLPQSAPTENGLGQQAGRDAADLPDWLASPEQAPPEPAAARTFPERAQVRPPRQPTPAPTLGPSVPPPPPAGGAAVAAPAWPALDERAGEPPQGERYRVVVKGQRVAFPTRICAHCLRSPAPARLAVVGTWPTESPGKRRDVALNLPLCDACRRRASARSEAERTARLQAHLVSALVALGLLVGFLAVGLVDVRSDMLVGGLIVAILLAIGYSLPAILLLGRVARFPPPPDAVYVRSTLLIAPDPTGLETAFEWRNRHYAELFYQANLERVTGAITPVRDRLAAAGD